MDRVTSAIEILTAGLYVVSIAEGRVIQAAPGQEGGYHFWDDLSESQRPDALTVAIDWRGFTESQREGVIRRVLEGDEPDLWMDGIEESYPSAEEIKALAAEIRSDEHAARVRDYGETDAATYGQRVADGADAVRHLAPELPAVSSEDMDRVLPEIEQRWQTPQERLQNILDGKGLGVERHESELVKEKERER
ncbi:hypothetical protein [Tautonia marina]|uniref:hypothetical protein n=1 Tax=Tautonia marina TaxID=2653855 RepID=UPI0013758A17|nr:hypothetical protein [Tautonia marina]